jgi:homopolymeric O-antigen transport system permease protein
VSVLESELRRAVLTNAPPVTIIEPSRGWLSLNLREIWAYHELLYFLIWRDVKVRYKQTAIGAIWVILQPLLTMVVFTLVFNRIANISSDGLPYPIFAYAALLPWNLFAGALNRSGTSLVGQSNLISKVYFPRLIIPFSATVSGVVDFAIAFVILIAMMVWYGVAPNWGVLALPLFILLALTAAFSVGLWLSALNVRYRDAGYALPFLIQLWLFASPVAYPTSLVPEQWQFLYNLNPMAGVIEGFRWALLGKAQPDFGVIAVSAAAVIAVLLGGLVYFKRTERTFADVV